MALELEPILRAVTICARWTGFLPTSTISCSAASGNMASSWTDRPSVLTSVTEGGVDERHLVLVPDCSRVLFRGALAASGWRVSGGGTAGKTLPLVTAAPRAKEWLPCGAGPQEGGRGWR